MCLQKTIKRLITSNRSFVYAPLPAENKKIELTGRTAMDSASRKNPNAEHKLQVLGP